MSAPSGRLGVGIIGMGTAGPVIGSALRAAGHQVIGVAAHSAEAIERADILLPGVPVLPIEVLVERSELVVLAVPDAEISGFVSGLADLGAWRMGQLLIHLAGPYGTGILDPARAAGVIPLAIHPVLRLTGWSADVQRFTGAPFLVTAPAPFLPIAQALVVEMGGEPILVDEESRARVDAALALGAAGVISSVVASLGILEEAGIDHAALLASRLLPEAAAEAIEEGERVLGAPYSTADAEAIRLHALALADADPAAHSLYISRAREAIDLLASRGRIDERAANAARTALLEE